MKKSSRERFIELTRPLYVAVRLVVVMVYRILFFWFEVWDQWKSNEALLNDIQANLYFLCSSGEISRGHWYTIHPFDYAVIRIVNGNIRFCFTRGQMQLNIRLAPRHNTRDAHKLHLVLAALDGIDITEQKPARYLDEVAELLRPRIDKLNQAFSPESYPEFRKKLSLVDARADVLRRQAEWELNRSIYRWGRS